MNRLANAPRTNALTRLLPLLCAFVPWCEAFGAPHPSLPPPVVPECFGVNIHFTDPKPGEMEMLAAAGFKWVRMDLTWSGTEREKGQYDFSAYDRLVAALDRHKLRAVFILDYGNPLYAEPGDTHPFTSRAGTTEFRDAYAKWAVAAVSHFKGRGYLWELWNEPNHPGFWKPKPNATDYAALAKTTGEALRAAGLRGECLIGPATSTIDLAFLEACFKAGLLEYWDAVSVHPYRQTAPETVEEEYRSLRLLIRKYAPTGKDIPIISGEWGYSTAWPNLGQDEAAAEEKQAKYLARQFLTNMANDVVLSIWYDWRDDGDNPKQSEHRFGLVRRQYHEGRDPVFDPKPAYQAMKTLTEQLGGMRFNNRILWDYSLAESGNQFVDRHLLFHRDRSTCVVTWSVKPGNRVVFLPSSAAKFTAISYLGAKSPVPAQAGASDTAGKLKFTVGTLGFRPQTEPIYYRPSGAEPVWQVAAASERAPLEVIHRVGDPDPQLRITNPLNVPISLWARENPTTGRAVFEGVGAKTSVPRTYFVHARSRVLPGTIQPGASFSLVTKNGLVQVRQPVHAIITNPIRARAFSRGRNFVPIMVTNPSGEAWKGSLRVTYDQMPSPLDRTQAQPYFPVELGKDETEKLVRIPLPPEQHTSALSAMISDLNSYWCENGFQGRWLPDLGPELQAVIEGDKSPKTNVEITTQEPPDGGNLSETPSIRLRYGFDVGWQFARLLMPDDWRTIKDTPPGSLPTPAHLGLWLHGDGKGCQARIRFKDKTGQVFRPDGPRIDWKGWRYVTFPMRSTEEKPLAHWGGANDGVIHYPIEWDSIFLLDNVSRQAVEGEIYLSAPTLIY